MNKCLNLPLIGITLVLTITLLLGCKKEETPTVSEYGKMAKAKLLEIQALSADIPCSEQANVSAVELTEGCTTFWYVVKSSDMSRFKILKKEHADLINKQTDAMNKMGIVTEPCFPYIWITEQPIQLECKSGKVELITSANLSIEEARPLAEKTYEEIMMAVNAQTCTSATYWTTTPLVKDKFFDLQFIPYLQSQDHSDLKKKIELYNVLKLRIIQSEGAMAPVGEQIVVDRVDCVNGKPVVKLKT